MVEKVLFRIFSGVASDERIYKYENILCEVDCCVCADGQTVEIVSVLLLDTILAEVLERERKTTGSVTS